MERRKFMKQSSEIDPRFPDVRYWVGEGDKACTLTISWNETQDSRPPTAYYPFDGLTWGYRWSGEATLNDMLEAIVAEDNRLCFIRQYVGTLGSTVCGIGYCEPNVTLLPITFDLEGAKINANYSYPRIARVLAADAITAGKQSGIIDHPFGSDGTNYPAYDYDYWEATVSATSHWCSGLNKRVCSMYYKTNDTNWSWARDGMIYVKEQITQFIVNINTPLADMRQIGLSFAHFMGDPYGAPPTELNYVRKQ